MRGTDRSAIRSCNADTTTRVVSASGSPNSAEFDRDSRLAFRGTMKKTVFWPTSFAKMIDEGNRIRRNALKCSAKLARFERVGRNRRA
ncbi:hypothetical protein PMSM_16235 [Paenibacillus macquariensis subsp. macquariensis]|uniref:hypothetical protein n=1 Tax=Paenibacillus macquariensis TaxID=948756 RepID=UPI0007C22730|nr:hypothetical protein [Paenibacillus macquariensis]OAB33100.1 hypothetical protein PMSM_16235 [Paenibacillus macquariensis subsp. macquariensis]